MEPNLSCVLNSQLLLVWKLLCHATWLADMQDVLLNRAAWFLQWENQPDSILSSCMPHVGILCLDFYLATTSSDDVRRSWPCLHKGIRSCKSSQSNLLRVCVYSTLMLGIQSSIKTQVYALKELTFS